MLKIKNFNKNQITAVNVADSMYEMYVSIHVCIDDKNNWIVYICSYMSTDLIYITLC